MELFNSTYIVNLFTPHPLVSFLQKWKLVKVDVNSFEPRSKPVEIMFKDSILYLGKIQYGESYPNSYLDIYIPNGELENVRPTFIYVHGGGFPWRDKVQEDTSHYLTSIAKNGYNVVSINYALARDYRYPIPLYQIDEAVKFLLKNEKRYGLEMSRVLFAGGSAGGQLIGQYVNTQTNSKYAKEMEIPATLHQDEIIAVVFNSALLDASRFDKTGDLLTNFVFNALGRLYFDTNYLMDSQLVNQSNVIQHITADFPPTFITDGNTATFTDQAMDLEERMTELAIPHQFNYYKESMVKLGHGYANKLEHPYAKDNLNEMFKFIEEINEYKKQ